MGNSKPIIDPAFLAKKGFWVQQILQKSGHTAQSSPGFFSRKESKGARDSKHLGLLKWSCSLFSKDFCCDSRADGQGVIQSYQVKCTSVCTKPSYL